MGSPHGIPTWDPIWDPHMGSPYGIPIWDPHMGIPYGSPTWDPCTHVGIPKGAPGWTMSGLGQLMIRPTDSPRIFPSLATYAAVWNSDRCVLHRFSPRNFGCYHPGSQLAPWAQIGVQTWAHHQGPKLAHNLGPRAQIPGPNLGPGVQIWAPLGPNLGPGPKSRPPGPPWAHGALGAQGVA